MNQSFLKFRKNIDDCAPFLEAVRKEAGNHNIVAMDVTHSPKSVEIALEARRSLANTRDRRIVSITISTGAAERGENALSPGRPLKKATRTLYADKENGRIIS